MHLTTLALTIPQKYRTELLEKNHYYKAVISFTDPNMMWLWFIWANFVEPSNQLYAYKIVNGVVDVNDKCGVCLQNLYKKWTAMMPVIVEMEKEYKLLQNL